MLQTLKCKPATICVYILCLSSQLLVVGHLVWRWQWRRKKLSHFKSHVPGDKSFKCKVRLSASEAKNVQLWSPILSLCRGSNRDWGRTLLPSRLSHQTQGWSIPTSHPRSLEAAKVRRLSERLKDVSFAELRVRKKAQKKPLQCWSSQPGLKFGSSEGQWDVLAN